MTALSFTFSTAPKKADAIRTKVKTYANYKKINKVCAGSIAGFSKAENKGGKTKYKLSVSQVLYREAIALKTILRGSVNLKISAVQKN